MYIPYMVVFAARESTIILKEIKEKHYGLHASLINEIVEQLVTELRAQKTVRNVIDSTSDAW